MFKDWRRPTIVLASLLMVVMLLVTSCTSSSNTTTPPTTTPPTTSPPATTPTKTTPPTTTPPTTTPPTTTPPVTSPAIPPEVSQYVKDWPLPNRDYTNSRATTDSTINAANVNTLGAAWAVPLPGVGAFGSASTTPIIMGNTAYFQDLGNNIFAVDLATGKIKWKHLFNESNIGPNGIAVGWGKIFGNSDPYTIVALDVNTGAQLWSTRISQQPTSGIDIQPNVYGNLVLVSTVPGTGGGDFYTGGGFGAIYALDQTSGKIMWNFDTVDSADIWGNKDVNSGGGAWYPPAVDTSTGTSFWGIGNPAPWPGTPTYPNGSSRPGPNLYTDSLVALNDTNGNLAWFTQVNQHDNSDADFEASPILASATVSGKQQDVVIGAGKLGKVVAFNRQTGAILWMTPVGMHQNDQLVNIPAAGAQVYPGIFGGVETPMAYAGGVVYVPVVNLYANLTPGAVTGTQPFNQGTGELVALDVNTGKILWDKSFNSLDVGGATVVNDLVFTSTLDGMVYALNRTTGAQVWSYQAPGGVNAWPAFAGDTMLLPVGLGSPFSVVLALKLGANSPALAMTPLDGTSLESGNITVSAMALNFKLVALLGDTNVAGEGHLHYFMDVDAPTVQGQPAVTSTGVYTATANTTYTFSNVTPGTHTFSVELVNNDHTPLNPPVVAKVTVTVTAPTPKITITSPQNRASIKPGDITISVSVSNFNLVDKIGQAIASGEGHIIYYMDVVPPTDPTQAATTAAGTYAATAATSYTWQNVAAGTHTFFVELVNNDNTPLTTPVVIQVVVTVTASTGGGP